MKNKKQNLIGFDFIRSFAVFFVFLAHILNKQSENAIILLIEKSISPGLTMSVLGFISGYLLSTRYTAVDGAFYVKRFSRIYSTLFVCLASVSLFHTIYLPYDVVNQHSIIHFMGLSYFFELFRVANQSSIGAGLWFVTIILILYLLLPFLLVVFNHRNHKAHLIILVIVCLMINEIMYGTASTWNVVIGFCIGCYMGIHSSIEQMSQKPAYIYLSLTIIVVAICALARLEIVPKIVRDLILPLYPFCAVPFLFQVGEWLGAYPLIRRIIAWFSGISYEVYILHFYFINDYFKDLFPSIENLLAQIFLALAIVLSLSTILSIVSKKIHEKFSYYLLY